MSLPRGLQCRSWLVEVPEPPTTDPAARLAAQEAYLRSQIAPWLTDLDDLSHPLGQVASFHFMRYLDPVHFPGWGITIVPSFLGTAMILACIHAEIEERLDEQQRAGAITRYSPLAETPWDATVIPEYGGPPLGPAFAVFLAAATRMTLQQSPGWAAPPVTTISANWAHCFSLITTGIG